MKAIVICLGAQKWLFKKPHHGVAACFLWLDILGLLKVTQLRGDSNPQSTSLENNWDNDLD